MSELKTYDLPVDHGDFTSTVELFYLKSEADKVIAELEESHKMEIDQLLIEIVKLKEIDSKNRSAYYKDLAMMTKDVERQKYNRCLLRSVIAEMNAIHFKDLFYGEGSESLADEYNKQITIHYKWQIRWLALAEKFKEAK